MTVRIFIAWLCLTAIAIPASAQSKRSMPKLDLPEYVISGVEKATHIGGEKLSLQTEDPALDIPALGLRHRPLIPVGQIIVQPQQPQNIAGLRFDYHNYSLSAGGFRSFKSTYNTAIRTDKFTLTANGWYDRAPRNIRAGEILDQGLSSSIIVRTADKGVFNFAGQFERSSFIRNKDIDQNVSASDLSLMTTGSSLRSRLGDLSYSAKMNRWHLKGDIDNAVWSHDLRVGVSRRMKHGRLRVNVRQFGEPTELNANDFGYSNLYLAYSWRQTTDWRISLGTSIFTTSSYTFDGKGLATNRENNGIKLELLTEKKLSDRDVVYFQFKPIENPISAKALYNFYPMMSDSIGGIVESGSRVVGGYSRTVNQQFRINAEAFYQNTLDHPVPVSLTENDWFLETARFTATGIKVDANVQLSSVAEMNIFASWQDAKVSKGEIDMVATEEAELSAGISGEYRLEKWNIAGDLIWYDQKPINLRGTETIPAYTEFNARASYRLRSDILLSLTAENLFNQRYYSVPGYDANPLTVMVGVSHVVAK